MRVGQDKRLVSSTLKLILSLESMEEIWLNINLDEYKDAYQISNLGRIRSLDRMVAYRHGLRKYSGRTLNPSLNCGTGYYRICLSLNSKYKHIDIHRLVALTFIANSENLPEVNHKNGIKTDNTLENLEWCDRQYNITHAWELGLSNLSNRARHEKLAYKLTLEKAREIRSLYEKDDTSYRKLALQFNVGKTLVEHIIKNKKWKEYQCQD